MTPLHVTCSACGGTGGAPASERSPWPLCSACDGRGYTWAPGAPRYGCAALLGDREPGEIVTLGNGDRGRILRHCRAGTATTWLGLIGDFSGIESHTPVPYPSCAGVAEVEASRARGDRRSHANARAPDAGDPLQRGFQLQPHRR